MIDFTTLQGLTIPEGVVTQIADVSGRVLWMVSGGEDLPISLEVAKVSFTSYAGETSYPSECVLLDIYPKKSNSTVKVTYGGLTKTLVFSGTNAQQVFFGTYNGETDSVTTPASGTLTIEDGCAAFGHSAYQSSSKATMKRYAVCITSVVDWGSVEYIAPYAFYGLQGEVKIALDELPDGITSIGASAFRNCSKITVTEIPHGVKTIGAEAFWMTAPGVTYNPQTSMTEIILPSTIENIGEKAFACDAADGYTKCYLSKVTILATTPPVLGTNVFGNKNAIDAIEIYVPKGCGATYEVAEGWSTYAAYIVEAS